MKERKKETSEEKNGVSSFEINTDPTTKLWSTILADLRGTMTKATYEMHFSQTRAIERVNGCLVVSVPNDQSQDWLQQRWIARVLRAAKEADPTLEMVKFKVGEG